MVAATAHKGLMEVEATPAQTTDMSVPSEAAFSGVMSDSSASVKARHPRTLSCLHSGLLLLQGALHLQQCMSSEGLWLGGTP